MKQKSGTPMTLEERLERAARSQAASPEAAARLVQRLAQMHTALVFTGSADLERMYGLTGECMERLEEDLMHYGGFCRSFQMAIENDFPLLTQGKAAAIYQPVLGARVNNAVVLLGLMLLDHARGRRRDKDVYHCTRMTLGQYLDALPKGEAPWEAWRFQKWRDRLLARHDPSAPLADVLADILRHYIAGWRILNRLDCILDARTCSADLPDPGAEDTAGGAVRDQLFLSRGDYSPQALEELAGRAPSPEFRALLEEQIDPERLKWAMAEINTAVTDLFMLWVEPYPRMEGSANEGNIVPGGKPWYNKHTESGNP